MTSTPPPSNPVHLGIDTGGTYTDAVLFDPLTRRVLRSVKVLTTHRDLTICVAAALDQLLDPGVSLVSAALSTTLATNAIAEGKRHPVALLLLGYDSDLVHRYGFHHEFGAAYYFFIGGRHDLAGQEQAPLDEAGVLQAIQTVGDRVDAIAVASYAGPMNPAHEQRAAALIHQVSQLPVVQAHQLSSELDSIRRAITASLNASLLLEAQAFLEAVKSMLHQRGIHCPVMMVKGDGSLARADYVRDRPIEIIHSGPATSAIGGRFLAGVETALVIDIGGTTTDLVVMEDGRFQAYDSAATVGAYRTCVRTIKTRSLGLGGDSLIRFDHYRTLTVGPGRAIPLSRLCSQYPDLKQEYLAWLHTKRDLLYSDSAEFWLLRREPNWPALEAEGSSERVARLRQVVDLLRNGPQRASALRSAMGARSFVLVDRDALIRQDVLELSALTPTDLLHAAGEYTLGDIEAPQALIEAAARIWGETPTAFIRRVRSWITRRIMAEVVQFLSDKTLSTPGFLPGKNGLDRWLLDQSLEAQDPYLGCALHLKMPVVGIGAPARSFLPPVAAALGADIYFPDHYPVANAVGTVVGNVLIQHDGQVFPCVEGQIISGYYARAASEQRKFPNFADALEHARTTLLRQAGQDAIRAGAHDASLECQVEHAWEGMAFLHATAIGKPSLHA